MLGSGRLNCDELYRYESAIVLLEILFRGLRPSFDYVLRIGHLAQRRSTSFCFEVVRGNQYAVLFGRSCQMRKACSAFSRIICTMGSLRFAGGSEISR